MGKKINKIDITWLAQNSIYDFPAMYGFVKTSIAKTTVIYLDYRKLEKPEKREKLNELSKQAIIELNYLRTLTCKSVKEALFIDITGMARDMFIGVKMAQEVITKLVGIYIAYGRVRRRRHVVGLFKKLNIYIKRHTSETSELERAASVQMDDKGDICRNVVIKFNAAPITKGFDAGRVYTPLSQRHESAKNQHRTYATDDAISLSVREVLKAFGRVDK